MSRIKSRAQTEICGDCGASDPSWASINRGILLCSECCSVHRSLGRHVSQIKSLRQGKWTPAVLNLVNALTALGANNVWEHSLQDPKSARRKPQAKDPVHPNKADFIRAKHVNGNFVLKPQDVEPGNLETELNKQLHASVRAPNLETSLRLLSQGADPNYLHEEKGSTPLHMAAKSGQALQVELLLVFGADIQTPDSNRQTAIDLARANKHLTIAERLTEASYEVTDRLCYFLCNRRPDHAANQHIIVPEQNGVEISEPLKIARGKLLLIPNKMFEELMMDLYDEVDRRETEAVWSTSALNPEIGAVPFLPVNPLLSATRNQGRQKLARFTPVEFAGLLTDVLIDAKRRQNLANLRPSLNDLKIDPTNRCSNLSDDEPVYDAVASDDDYAALAPVAQQSEQQQQQQTEEEAALLKRQLEESQQVINELQNKIKKLATENTELKSRLTSQHLQEGEEDEIVELRSNGGTDLNGSGGVGDIKTTTTPLGMKRPMSMYEAREKPPLKYGFTENRATTSLFHMDAAKEQTMMPLNEEVKRHTNLVTRRIQELVTGMLDLSGSKSFVPYGDSIRGAVTDLCAIFPSKLTDQGVEEPLQMLRVNAQEMQRSCGKLTESLLAPGTEQLEATLNEVRQCAYNLARAIKDLVTRFEI